MSKILNIALMATLFIPSTFAMKSDQTNLQNMSKEIIIDIMENDQTSLEDLPLEIIAHIADYCLGNFPENRNDFIKQYKNFLELKLINKTFNNSINELFKNEKMWNKFEDHIFNVIKNKSLNIKDELFMAAQNGSKKYFENLKDDEFLKFAKTSNKDIITLIKIVLDNSKNQYSEKTAQIIIKKIMGNKFLNESILAHYNYLGGNYFNHTQRTKLRSILLKNESSKTFKLTLLGIYIEEKMQYLTQTSFQVATILYLLNRGTDLEIKTKDIFLFLSFANFFSVFKNNSLYNNKTQFLTVSIIAALIYINSHLFDI